MTEQMQPSVKIATTLWGGYYVCSLGYAGKPWSKGADEGKVSPTFLTRDEAIKWAEARGMFVHGK